MEESKESKGAWKSRSADLSRTPLGFQICIKIDKANRFIVFINRTTALSLIYAFIHWLYAFTNLALPGRYMTIEPPRASKLLKALDLRSEARP